MMMTSQNRRTRRIDDQNIQSAVSIFINACRHQLMSILVGSYVELPCNYFSLDRFNISYKCLDFDIFIEVPYGNCTKIMPQRYLRDISSIGDLERPLYGS